MVYFTGNSLNQGDGGDCSGSLTPHDMFETSKTLDSSGLIPMGLLMFSQANPHPCSACHHKHGK